jgi:hypothetical protein
VLPAGADKEPARRAEAGQFTPWLDLGQLAGRRLHGRLRRSGGVAEFPNVTADFVCEAAVETRHVIIELATAPREDAIVKRFEESFRGSLTSFLVSPHLRADAASLETAAQMTARRLQWARGASSGHRSSPQQLLVQTSFWSPQRPELNVQEAAVLHLLGFNLVGNQMPEVRQKFGFRVPGHSHDVLFGPAATPGEIDALMKKHAAHQREPLGAGVPFGFSDEICARPPIGDDRLALQHFHAWLAQRRIDPRALGVSRLPDVRPIETPEQLRQRLPQGEAAARRVFYYTSRFRQHAATERIRWHTEAFHKHFPPGPMTSTLVADHPYFSGSGLGMGMTPNPTWGGSPLACDWFELARHKAVDMIGIEDWMGLQYMYGPNTTWEGFQLMGFQAAMFRSGSRGELPIIAWITPSDETNLRLKSMSALCQGAKHFFYWTYGPTATSTENYWSDLRSAYDGIVSVTRKLAAAEHLLAPGKPRQTRVALLYSISSDLWQPFGYVHMLERRGTYLALVHEQYLVDMLTEEDIAAGRLDGYGVLYATDPCIAEAAQERIEAWVRKGGHLYGTTAAGSRNEFDEPVAGLARVFGIEPQVKVEVQPGNYHIRGALNGMSYLDHVRFRAAPPPGGPAGGRPEDVGTIGVLGVKVAFAPGAATVIGAFDKGSPAATEHAYGQGCTRYIAACPALAYIKEARFVPAELREKWPAEQRRLITTMAARRTVPRLVELSQAVVEAGVYDSPRGTALVLANFTYEPVPDLGISLPVARPPQKVRSLTRGEVKFSVAKAGPNLAAVGLPHVVHCSLNLGLDDIVLCE